MKSVSIWEGSAEAGESYPSLQGEISADVVVIGGGISGLTAAMQLSDAGKKVVVLEARKIGLGTTGNSTGNLYVTVDERLSEIKDKWSADVMKAVVNSRSAALNLIEQTISRFNIDCDFYRTSFNYFVETLNEDTERLIKEEYEVFAEAGLHPRLSDNPGLPFNARKSLSIDGQAQFHPYKYAVGLAGNISPQCEIYEGSTVIDVDEKEGLVKTAGGSVKADSIIMATHTPKGVWMVQGVLGAYREFGVAADLVSGDFPRGVFWGLDQPKHSIRTFRRGDKAYIMVIGDKFKTGHPEDTNDYVEHLEQYLKSRFNIGSERFIWGGQQYRSADGLPFIGRHSEKLYFLTGFATDGLVYGTLGAMIISNLIQGRENAWEATYHLKRFTPVKSFREFFRESVDNIAQYIRDTPWNVDAKSLEEILPGQGKVMESGGEKIAVYKDKTGEAHVVSAVCTHMKCIVNWNSVELTWDCPCHGSRFTIDGGAIEGPAIANLPKKTIKK